MKKFLSIFLATIMLAAAVTGCSGSDNAAPSTGSDSGSSAPATADGEVVTLKIAHNMDFVTIPDSVIEAADRLTKRYAEEGKNITIEFDKDYQRIDWGEYHNNLVFAEKSGNGPDMFHLSDDMYGLVDAEMLMDLSDVKSDAFVDGIFTPFTIDNTVYGMPFDMPLRVIYYNKSSLKGLGWSEEDIAALPQKIAAGEFSFEDFIALAKEVQETGNSKYGLAHRPGAGSDFLDVLNVLGGEYYDENGKLVFDEQGLKRFFEFTYDNANVSKITPQDLNQMGWDTINSMVGNGEAFAYYGPLYSSTYVAQASDKTTEELVEDVSFVLFPVSEYNDKPFASVAPQGMGINANTKYPEICKDLLIELSNGSADLLANHASKILTLSSVKEANTMEAITSNPVLKEVTYMADYGVTPPTIEGIATFNSELHKQIVSLELGQTTPDQAINEFKTQMELNIPSENIIFK